MGIVPYQLAAMGLFLVIYALLYDSVSVPLPTGVALGFLCGFGPWWLSRFFTT